MFPQKLNMESIICDSIISRKHNSSGEGEGEGGGDLSLIAAFLGEVMCDVTSSIS